MPNNKSASAKLTEIVTLMDTVGPAVTISTMKAFIAIASANDDSPGMNMADLGSRLGLASASRTNVVNMLSVRRTGKDKFPGLDLVLTTPDPDDPRAKLIFLTPKGRRLWAGLKQTMEG